MGAQIPPVLQGAWLEVKRDGHLWRVRVMGRVPREETTGEAAVLSGPVVSPTRSYAIRAAIRDAASNVKGRELEDYEVDPAASGYFRLSSYSGGSWK